MTKLLTNTAKLNAAEQILESISEPANTTYYMFVGDHETRANSDLQPIYDTLYNTTYAPYRNMIFGKRITSNDIKIMVRNIPYVSNTIYAMFDDQDSSLYNKDFFVIVDAGSYFHVYKCLDNNGNTYSTIIPDISHISGSNTNIYQTADGYRWKYMYSVDSDTEIKFSTENYFPVESNTSVSNSSTTGAIDIIKIIGEGRGYDNYVTGTFSADNIKVGGNTRVYGISNTMASAVNGFYTDCLLYISTGTGAGEYKTVEDYFANDTGNYVVTNSSFFTAPVATSEYEIYPRVVIVGGGEETTNAVARALVNATSSNSIYRIEMIDRGVGYTYATATVSANDVVDITSAAEVRPIKSPYFGHGNNVARELGAHHLEISVKFSNTESNTITIDNIAQQVGIMRNPLFANVSVEIQSNVGIYTDGELTYKINPLKVDANATVNTTSVIISSNTGDYVNQFVVGQWVYLAGSNGSSHQIAQINSITNSTSMNLSSNCYFACTDTIVYQANVSTSAYIISSNAATINFANVNGIISTNDIFIGVDSGAKLVANNISIGGITKTFDTFMQLYKYIGMIDSGTFIENEIIYQENATALLHSSNVDGAVLTIYTSNQVGQFIIDGANVLIGNTSGATASLNTKYDPDLVFGSGEILFLENVQPITRSANTNETFQLIFEY